MKSLSIVVLVALVLIGSFAVQSDAGGNYYPKYKYPRGYKGGYNGYPRGNYGWNKGWKKGRWGRKYY
uniref:Foot protein 3 variant 1 n=1 Tax=Mytilus californianus TaxID=6549 RepID=Q2VPV7_MYTCA|nr:foot protein 3 variant 1 [Mytilus californianus]